MSKIKVKNFGPIKKGNQSNDGWIDIKKITVFIGQQGSGKSTVAKLISTFTWMEKALVRGDYDIKGLSRKNKLKNQFLKYHRLEKYLNENSNSTTNTIIEYRGDAYTIKYAEGILDIKEKKHSSYPLPQIMYVPAERNFISYVKTPNKLKLSSASLQEFLTEFDNAKNNIKGSLSLPINNVNIEYDKLNDVINVKGDGYKIGLTDSSSGFQSLVPLYLVSKYLSNSIKHQSAGDNDDTPMSSEELMRFRLGFGEIISNKDLTSEQRRAAISVLSSKFNKTAFINIVEEPEQNLFPSSQRSMINSLLEFNNENAGNKLILTTHSPYLVNYLTIAIKGGALLGKVKTERDREKRNDIVPLKSLVKAEDIVIYELGEIDGEIKQLEVYKGLPSDENKLNEWLEKGNDLFSQLLEIEQGL